MSDLKWSYLAGVFDGEGSYCAPTWSITQSENNIVLLDWICEFLDDQEIPFSWGEFKKSQKRYNYVRVSKQDDVLKLLLGMLPYLKRVDCSVPGFVNV